MLLRAALVLASLSCPAAVDLHVHLLMDAAIPGLFHGHPTSAPAKAKGRFSNQVSLKDLEESDVRLVVAALYAPIVYSTFRGGETKALLKQVSAVEAWAAQDSRIALVRTPDEAQAVLKSKDWKLGVILSAEGGHGADTPAKLDALYDRGLRLLTLTHFSDNAWGGAAAVRYWPKPSCRPGGRDNGRRNAKGLSKEGEALADHAVEKGILLDLTHASDKLALDVARRYPSRPLIFTHEGARELTPCERMISPELLREVERSGGLVGLTFASMYVGTDLGSLRKHAAALAREAGPRSIALGSDYNGLITPVGTYSEVLRALGEEGIPARHSAEAFVEFWRRTISAGDSSREQ